MSRAEADALMAYIRALDQRVARLERALLLGGLLFGVVPTCLQLFHIFWSHCP